MNFFLTWTGAGNRWRRWGLAACACVASLVLLGCGGGGGGSSSGASSSTTTGYLTLRLIGGASADYAHVYVTLNAVAFHTSADQPWSATDTSWQVVTFSTPQQVDLANLANGSYAALLTQRTLPSGTYRQMRLFAAPSGAQAVGAGGATTSIEWPDTLLGLRVPVNFTVAQNALTQLYLQWDLDHSLVPMLVNSGAATALSLRPNLATIDLANSSGAIVGTFDTASFCSGTTRTGCISNVVATAQLLSADASRHVVVLSTQVDASNGSFRLFPLPSGGTFDVVFHGRNMRPIVVRSVVANVIDLFTNGTHINPNTGSTTDALIVPTLVVPDQASAALSISPVKLADASVWIGQTLSGSAPYEWTAASADPLTGLFASSTFVPSGAAIDVASYTGATLTFSTVAATEGAGTYRAKAYGTSYDLANGLQTVTPPAAVAGASADTSLQAGSIAVNFSATTPANYDRAQVVVSDVNGVVLSQDVSGGIAAPTVATLTVPRGTAAANLGGTAVYSVSVRGWKIASPQTATWARSSTVVDLRSASSGAVTLALP